MSEPAPLRVLVVDDSAFNRKNLVELLVASGKVEVVGKAADGEEALQLVAQLRPDALTLDLEMPRMDGFTFLRILMSKLPTPVIVVSSYSQKENVFKALELGAVDFVAKPDRQSDVDLRTISSELLQKLELVRSLRASSLGVRRAMASLAGVALPEPTRPEAVQPPRYVVGIASSNGGPAALVEIFARLGRRSRATMAIAQHMPDRFTKSFAERLDKRSQFSVVEATDGDRCTSARALVCPGRQCLEVVGSSFAELRCKVLAPTPEDRYVPSADRLLASVGRFATVRSVGVVLTGMGDDGLHGARVIREAGGVVLCESEQSAVVYGMPGAVVRAGLATHVLSLGEIAEWLAALG
jgi:two-component system, chemotaxis family, protein-glutamate methylesterase/glutaminase